MNNAAQRYAHALAVALQCNVALDRLVLWSTRTRNQRKHPFADAVERQNARRIYVAQHADNTRVLLIEADDHLGLDRSVAQPSNDGLLNFR